MAYNLVDPKGSVKELAKWKQDRIGFPCRIIWGNIEHICESKDILENTLVELLCDSTVGEMLFELMEQDDSIIKKCQDLMS